MRRPAGRCPPCFPKVGKTADRKGEIPVIKTPSVHVNWRFLEARRLGILEQKAWKAAGSPHSRPRGGLVAAVLWEVLLQTLLQRQVIPQHSTRASPAPSSWVILRAPGAGQKCRIAAPNADLLDERNSKGGTQGLPTRSHLGKPMLLVMTSLLFV